MDPLTPTSKQDFRDNICQAVLFRIEQEVAEITSMLPEDAPAEVGESIRKEILDHSRAVMDALSLDELLCDSALERHIIEAARWATHRVHWYEARRERA